MASEKTIYSKNGDWKIKVQSWKDNFIFYSSIGTAVDVYHQEKTSDTWGKDKIDWVLKNADVIFVNNQYSDSKQNIITSSKRLYNSSHCEDKLTGYNFNISFSITATGIDPSIGPQQTKINIENVKGNVTVQIGEEILSATVEANDIFKDSSIW